MNFDKNLFLMKAHFFMSMAGSAPIFPFLPLILKELGFSSISVAWIFIVYPLVVIFVKPVFGTIADRYRCHKPLFIAITLIYLIIGFGIQWLPGVPFSITVELLCERNLSLRICSGRFNDSQIENVQYIDMIGKTVNNTITCKVDTEKQHTGNYNQFEDETFIKWGPEYYFKESCLVAVTSHLIEPLTYNIEQCKNRTSIFKNIHCENADIMEMIKKKTVDDYAEMGTSVYWIAFAFAISFRVLLSIMNSFGDTFCFVLLGDKPQKYGAQRLWGAFSWGIFAFIGGILVDKFSEGKPNKNFIPSYYMLLVLLLLDLVILIKMEVKFSKTSKNISSDIKILLKDLRTCLFMLWCFLGGVYCAIIWNFLFWYIDDLALSSPGFDKSRLSTLEGLMLTIQCFLGEIPFFFASGWILKKIGSPKSMVIVLFTIGIRFLLYSSLTDPWWVLPIEILNGITFGLFYANMVTYTSLIAPPGTEATMQNLVGSLFEGGGVSIGSLIGGYLFKNIGGSKTMLTLGISALVFAVIYLFLQSKLETKAEVEVHKEILEEKDKKIISEELDKLTASS